MKTVTFTQGEPGFHVGDERTVPDEVAARLVEKGVATARPFPPADVAPVGSRAVSPPRRPLLSVGRRGRR